VACDGRKETHTVVLVGKPEGKKDHLEDPCVDGRILN